MASTLRSTGFCCQVRDVLVKIRRVARVRCTTVHKVQLPVDIRVCSHLIHQALHQFVVSSLVFSRVSTTEKQESFGSLAMSKRNGFSPAWLGYASPMPQVYKRKLGLVLNWNNDEKSRRPGKQCKQLGLSQCKSALGRHKGKLESLALLGS